jgi:predicted RNA-binding Zn-ribbon protein involved in translation (DUF1610 family)
LKDQNKQIRKRQSYQEWQRASQFLDGRPLKRDILKYMHGLLNGHSAYGSITKADFSSESLNLVLRETTKVSCSECDWAGTEADCGFGHNDFYCPNCGKESLVRFEDAVKVGESYGGDELMEALGGDMHDGLYAIGNDETIVVAEDEGNDNYKVVSVLAR